MSTIQEASFEIFESKNATFTPVDLWMFPHKTCEPMRPQAELIAQPYSFWVNVSIAVAMVAFLFTKGITWPTRTTIALFAAFEAFHALSHMAHWQAQTQITIVHVIAQGFALGICMCLHRRYGWQQRYQRIIFFAFAIDMAVLTTVGKIYQVLSGFGVLVSVVLSYYPLAEPFFQRRLMILAAGGVSIATQIFVEAACCSLWMKWNDTLPYHLLIEVVGFVLFVFLAQTLCLLETKERSDGKIKSL